MNDIEQIKEELFCLRYETSTFAGYVNYGKIERWIPQFTDVYTEDSHLKRYQLALNFVNNKVVLDVACGSGKGTFILASAGNAQRVVGLDVETDVIRYANFRHAHPSISFICTDATKYVKDKYFDTIISFETIEHVLEVNEFLLNVEKSLKDSGRFIVSTPISSLEKDENPKNPYHVREWGFKKFQELISQYFIIDEIYLQLYPYQDHSLANRVYRFIKKSLFNKNAVWEPNYSAIEKLEIFSKTNPLKELGTKRKGYQILVCKKKQ